MAKLTRARDTTVPRTGRAGFGAGWSVATIVAAVALALTMVLGLAWRIDSDQRAVWTRALEAEAGRAQIDAERAAALIDEATGALNAAARLGAGSTSTDAQDIAAAAVTPGVLGVAYVDAQGRIVAQTDRRISGWAMQAATSAGREETWIGVAGSATEGRAPAVVAKVGADRLVSVLNPQALLPKDPVGRTVAIVDVEGRVLAANDPSARRVEALFGMESLPAIATAHAFGRTPKGERVVVGFAPVRTGLAMFSGRPLARDVIAAILSALGAALIIAAPPIAGLIVLFGARQRVEQRAVTAEVELDRVQQHLQLAVDGARAGVWTLRRSQDLIELSKRLQGFVNAPAERMPISRFVSLAVEEDRPNLHAALIQAIESGSLEVTFRVVAQDQLHWVEMRGVAVENSDGEGPVLVGTALDITPRREAELRTVAVERRMKEAIESFTGTFALFDKRKRLIACNRAFARAFNLDHNTVRRGVSYDAISMEASKAIRSERSDPNDLQTREVELANGVWLQLVERPTLEGGTIVVGLDISTLKRQEEELLAKERKMRKAMEELERSEGRAKELKKRYEQEKKRAEEASKAKTAFLANMSHELRTPLNAINGFSEVIAREIFGPLGNPKYKEYAGDIQASGQLLLDMIGDILDMARIEAGKFNLAPRPLDPMQAIDQAVRLMRRRAMDKQIALTVDAIDVPEITADHRAVKQMLLNLLSNALKFTETGEVRVRARGRADQWLVMQVIDTGPGIPPDALQRLARPFEQVDAEYTRAHEGTGLGLALTKAFAELHGGAFKIDSVVGKGTVVTIELPPRPPNMGPDALDAAA